MRKRESKVRVRATNNKEKEKITKILNASATVTVCIYTITCSNCVFMYNFTLIDVNAFLVKICKIKSFLPFAKFCFYMLLSPITRRLFLRVLFFKVCLDNKKVLGWTVGRWEGRKVETLIFLFPYILR